MKLLFTAFFFLVVFRSQGQCQVAGDSTNRFIERINTRFLDASVRFDFDCDGNPDLTFNSSTTKISSSGTIYGQLGFQMAPAVEVLHTGAGKVTTFANGQLIYLNHPGQWTPNLSFIFGYSPMGNYGQSIDQKFIVFRKIRATDTAYFFMEVSNMQVDLTVHKVISTCRKSMISPVPPLSPEQAFMIYPNPFTEKLRFRAIETGEWTLQILDFQGKEIKTFRVDPNQEIDMVALKPGPYLLHFSNGVSSHSKRLLKK